MSIPKSNAHSDPKSNAHSETNEFITISADRDEPAEARARSAPLARNENVSELPGVYMLISRLERVLVDLRYLAADVHALETLADHSLASGNLYAACTAVQTSLAALQPPAADERVLSRSTVSAFHQS